MRFIHVNRLRIIARNSSTGDAYKAYLKSGGLPQNLPRESMYKILQVDVDVNPKQLRAAYTQRIKENHPDVAFRNPGQVRMLQVIYENSVMGNL